MQFKFYNEIDPEQSNEIMLTSHGEPAYSKVVDRIRKHDPFCSPWFRMFALDGDKVIAQVGAAYPTIETTEGTVKAGFVEAVAGMPSHARKGYAMALMKKVHEQMLDDGIEVFILTTSKTLVAYSMYPKLGYHDILQYNWGLKKIQKYPDTGISIKVRRHKIDDLDKMFRKSSKGQLGFVHRPNDYPRLRSSWGDGIYSKAVTFYRDGKPVGYALLRFMGEFLNVRELVTPNPKDFEPCIRTLENHFPKLYFTSSIMTRQELFKRYIDHGMKPMDSWGVVMVMDARSKLNQAGVKKLLGVDKDKFQCFTVDTY